MSVRPVRTSSACSNGSPRLPRSSARRSIWPCRPRTPPSARWLSTRMARRWRKSMPGSSARERRFVAEEEPQQPPETEQELVEQLQAELSRLQVSDLLVQTVYTISSLGYHRLSGDKKDLDQARLAIRALQLLVAELPGTVADEVVRDFNQVLANMQLAYASAAAEGPAEENP